MAESFSSLDNPFLLEYRDTLSGGADYFDINDVDNVDDYYDTEFKKAFSKTDYLLDSDIIGGEGGVGGGSIDFSPTRILSEQEYRGFVEDAPAYLSDFGNKRPDVIKTKQAYNAVQNLNSTEDLQDALSSYYGYDVEANEQSFSKSDFGGNLGQHTDSSDSELQQFHSLVEPILKDQITYLQATKGLNYQEALMESYNNDPMLQALYYKYDVSPVRQTEDGSTYLYDPFSFSEIRTLEVKDPSIKDIGIAAIKAYVIGSILGPIAGQISLGVGQTAVKIAQTAGVPAATATAIASTLTPMAATMAASAATSFILGGDPVKAALIAGIPIGNIPIPGTNGATLSSIAGNVTGGPVNFYLGGDPVSIALAERLSAVSSVSQGAGGGTGSSIGGGGGTGATPDFNPYINSIAASVAASNLEEEEQEATLDFAFNPYTESEEAEAAGIVTNEAENANNAAQEALKTPSSYTSAIDDYVGRYKEAMIRNRGRPSQASRFYLEKIRAAEAAEKQELNEKRIAANVAKGNYDAAVKNESEIRRGEERAYQAEKDAAYKAWQIEDAARKERNRIKAEEAAVARARADELAAKEETARIAREEAKRAADEKAAEAQRLADEKAAEAKREADTEAKKIAEEEAAEAQRIADAEAEEAQKIAKEIKDAEKEAGNLPPETDVTPPDFDDIDTDTTVDNPPPEIDDPEIDQKFVPPEEDASGGSSSDSSESAEDSSESDDSSGTGEGADEGDTGLGDIIAAQLQEAIDAEEDPELKKDLQFELSKWLSSGPKEFSTFPNAPKPDDYVADNEDETGVVNWVAALSDYFRSTKKSGIPTTALSPSESTGGSGMMSTINTGGGETASTDSSGSGASGISAGAGTGGAGGTGGEGAGGGGAGSSAGGGGTGGLGSGTAAGGAGGGATTGGSDSGSGTGTGTGDGSGSGAGAGAGTGTGMFGGAGSGGAGQSSVTDLVFSDYVKRYKAPELQKRVLPLQGYQAPQGLFRGII